MNKITQMLMEIVSELSGKPAGAYNIREDGQCAGRQSTDHIRITPKTSEPGIDIRVLPGTMGESVYIPACITHAGVNDLVYNDFYIGDGADVTIVAGCGVHSDGEEEARHNGIHRFFIGKGAHVLYLEKHVGTDHQSTDAGTNRGRRLHENGYNTDQGRRFNKARDNGVAGAARTACNPGKAHDAWRTDG